MQQSLRLANVIRGWSAAGTAAAVGSAAVLHDPIIMPAQAVLFFFTYIFATQWQERLLQDS
ncbi:hypothetical protein LJ759_16490 [Arthrobacter sp. zg-Y1110]|uniref:hypothetical protein n=1 Tax=Arthrobacter sp. zg-Y1110 TaxID=2886932 RepID=UPI001D15764B|nr:hypothetical protein [Arthrobacter sp. zg-Y1110]MCC3292516.1 hypothetical protein [Arthrobacter sp. zg-Y1110]